MKRIDHIHGRQKLGGITGMCCNKVRDRSGLDKTMVHLRLGHKMQLFVYGGSEREGQHMV